MPVHKANKVSGIAEMAVLRCLSSREMYGYELAQAVRDVTAGRMIMREGLLYPLLHSLTTAGHVTRRREVVDGRPRLYYKITTKGRNQLVRLRDEWATAVATVEKVLA
jgi:PadR family transcriptional regulator, regulatory protein PadR